MYMSSHDYAHQLGGAMYDTHISLMRHSGRQPCFVSVCGTFAAASMFGFATGGVPPLIKLLGQKRDGREFAVSVMQQLLSPAVGQQQVAEVEELLLQGNVVPCLASNLQPIYVKGEEDEARFGALLISEGMTR